MLGIGTQPEIIFIRPKHGRKVPIPQYMNATKEYFGDYLPENGLKVQKTLYWIRRKQDGDIEEVSEFPPLVQQEWAKETKEETQ